MNKKSLFTAWAALFILCAALGFIHRPEGTLKVLFLIPALLFFLPPVLILWSARSGRDLPTLRLMRNLSGLSLLITLILIVLNIMSVQWPAASGDFLNTVLIIVSSPMICSGQWALSLFLWACLLMGSLSSLRKIK